MRQCRFILNAKRSLCFESGDLRRSNISPPPTQRASEETHFWSSTQPLRNTNTTNTNNTNNTTNTTNTTNNTNNTNTTTRKKKMALQKKIWI